MSWSFKLRNGDLVAEGSHLATVRGESKLFQDLRLRLLEPIGTDNVHPEFGSSLEDLLGEDDLAYLFLEIENEISRAVQALQFQQLTRAKHDRYVLGRATLDPGEVIVNLTSVNITQAEDRLQVEVVVTTGSDEQLNITVPIDADPTIISTPEN